MIKFRQYLSEAPPHIDKTLTKDVYSVGSKSYRNLIHQNIHTTGKSLHLGDNHYHFINSDGDHVYYHHDGNNVKEISTISSNHIQVDTEKGDAGDSSHIHSFMLHHARVHGRLTSDTVHTNGSKHLWKTLIKKSPEGISFHHIHNGNTIGQLTKNNIDENESKIWGEGKARHQIEMRHTK